MAEYLAAIVPLLQELRNSVSSYYQRSDVVADNRDRLNRLVRDYNDGIKDIQYLRNCGEFNPVTSRELKRHKENLENSSKKLADLEQLVMDATVWDRVWRYGQVLQQCEEDLTRLQTFVKEKMTSLVRVDSEIQGDSFAPTSIVPGNPRHVVLDYSTTDTSEGQLKAVVLNENSGRIVSVIATGQGGVGKTCALRGLADDNDIKERFPSILYIQLSEGSSTSSLVSSLARIVERTGGKKLARKLRGLESLQDASEAAADWFQGKRCLFLIDDVWCVNDIDPSTLSVLVTVVNKSSRMVYTTRDETLLRYSEHRIRFEVREPRGMLARRMLLKHAGFLEDELNAQSRGAVESILDFCAGLPLAIGIAGALVWEQAEMHDPDGRWRAWKNVVNEISRHPSQYMTGNVMNEYGPLTGIVGSSLDVLSASTGGCSFQELFQAFCTLPKQTEVPEQALRNVWSTNAVETRRIMKKFHDVSLVQIRIRADTWYVQLHDLVLDIAALRASEGKGKQEYFRRLVRNYARSDIDQPADELAAHAILRRSLDNARSAFRIWVNCCFSSCKRLGGSPHQHQAAADDSSQRQAWWNEQDDSFIHENLCRMLRHAGNNDDLMWLLSQPEWIVSRLLNGGFTSVGRDIEHGIASVRGTNLGTANNLEYLDMISKATRLSSTIVAENPYEVWFQLCGRLIGHARQCSRILNFVRAVEKCAPRPFAMPVTGLLQDAGSTLMRVIPNPGKVSSVRLDGGKIHSFWVQERGTIGSTTYDLQGGTRKTVQCSWEVTSTHSEALHGALSNDLQYMASGYLCGKVVISRRSGKAMAVAQDHEGGVNEVIFSVDDRRVVSASHDKTVRLWNAKTGEAIGDPLVGHTDSVCCVAVSADGNHVISGSRDKTVRLWNAKTGEAIGDPLVGHTDSVCCVAVSADGNRVISGSRDKTVRLWNAETGEAIGDPLVGHTDSVLCVAACAHGGRIVSGSADNVMRIWEGQESQTAVASVTFRGPVLQVGMNASGSLVTSFDSAGGVRVWKVSPDGCTATSREKAQEEDITSLALTHSCSPFPSWRHKIIDWDGGEEVVLGSCDEKVVRIGNVYLTESSRICKILR